MTTLLIAIGNPWRRDDGAAARVVELVGDLPGAAVLVEAQPAPEMACEMAGAKRVVWIDADAAAEEVSLAPLEETTGAALVHGVRPGDVLALARRLYGFAGEALLCRVPAADLGEGEGLSDGCEAACRRAAALLREMLQGGSEA